MPMWMDNLNCKPESQIWIANLNGKPESQAWKIANVNRKRVESVANTLAERS